MQAKPIFFHQVVFQRVIVSILLKYYEPLNNTVQGQEGQILNLPDQEDAQVPPRDEKPEYIKILDVIEIFIVTNELENFSSVSTILNYFIMYNKQRIIKIMQYDKIVQFMCKLRFDESISGFVLDENNK